MKSDKILAFFRLVRWPNLVFIALTQSLFYFCIVIPSFYQGFPYHENILKPEHFVLLSLSSVLIAAAGYIINDYFDLNIDRINKPDKVVVEKNYQAEMGHHLALVFIRIRHSDRVMAFLETTERFYWSFQYRLCITVMVLQHQSQETTAHR